MALTIRYDQQRSRAGLDESTDAGSAALLGDGLPANRLTLSLRLAVTLLDRTEENESDLVKAEGILAEVATALPATSIHRYLMLTTQARADHIRHLRSGSSVDLDAAVSRAQEVLPATAANSSHHAQALCDVALALKERAGPGDLDEAVRLYRTTLAIVTAEVLAETEPDEAAAMLEAAVGLLIELVPRRLHRTDQHHLLGSRGGVAGDAAALALAAPGRAAGERAARALRLLETGRSVLRNQALDSRTHPHELRALAPDLAHQFLDTRRRLETMDSAPPVRTGLTRTPTSRRGSHRSSPRS